MTIECSQSVHSIVFRNNIVALVSILQCIRLILNFGNEEESYIMMSEAKAPALMPADCSVRHTLVRGRILLTV